MVLKNNMTVFFTSSNTLHFKDIKVKPSELIKKSGYLKIVFPPDETVLEDIMLKQQYLYFRPLR